MILWRTHVNRKSANLKYCYRKFTKVVPWTLHPNPNPCKLKPFVLEKRMTLEEYRAYSESVPHLVEFYDGEIIEHHSDNPEDEHHKGRTTKFHNTVLGNVYLLFRVHLRPKYAVYTVGIAVRLREETHTVEFLPDLEIVEADTDSVELCVVDKPVGTVEVLSKSTEELDRNCKLRVYMNTPSVREIVYLQQCVPQVEHYMRNAHNG
jgi:Uma2 family endonuclease